MLLGEIVKVPGLVEHLHEVLKPAATEAGAVSEGPADVGLVETEPAEG
jgi:hypothetical protein